ncbi:nitroreductase family deazaflavin-dependent oxidoreductase [Dactylosporangium sp. CA-233914]|uniref:nitroreductase family deazaflavin-dependent oxidoreductase n=1 Tax=Dactylosporangium sp. CA-233914 TaxID=3239934 RepID=UPI003D8B3AB4
MAEIPADLNAANRKLIAEFREHGRRLESRPLLLLSTTGRRSGKRYTNPMMYVRLDGRLLVIASAAGAQQHPDWYHNLVADPSVTVEADGEEYPATARPTTGEDRDTLFARIVEQYPFFADHQSGTDRRIPVVELIR